MPYVIQLEVKQKYHHPARRRSPAGGPRNPWGFFGPKVKQVKNLAWLLAHADEVVNFEAVTWPGPDGTVARRNPQAMMIAQLEGGDIYVCLWTSVRGMMRWLHRPKFQGLPLEINGKEMYC